MYHCSQQSWLPRDAACRFQVTKDSSSLGQHQQQPQAEIEKILDYTIPLSIEMKRSVCTTLIVLCLIRNNYTNCITTMHAVKSSTDMNEEEYNATHFFSNSADYSTTPPLSLLPLFPLFFSLSLSLWGGGSLRWG